MGSTFDLSHGYCGRQNGLHTHFAHHYGDDRAATWCEWTLRVHSHQAKAEAKEKILKKNEQKDKRINKTNSKKNFAFASAFSVNGS